jgi:NSS family neurotransmitter:Na+ symporter
MAVPAQKIARQASAKHQPEAPKRDAFVTSLGAIAATLGSAVGLGNIWKFPALTGQNGGAAFVLLYMICVA